jgi:hypothetical protein
LPLSSATWNQTMSFHPASISLTSIPKLSSNLYLGFPDGLSYPNPIHTSLLLLHTCHMPCPSYSPWFDYPNNIWSEYKSRRSSLCSLLQSPATSSVLECVSSSVSHTLTSPTYVLLLMREKNFCTCIKVYRMIQKQILHIITQNHTIRPQTCNSPVHCTLPKPTAFMLLFITKTVLHFAPVKAQCFKTEAGQFILLWFNTTQTFYKYTHLKYLKVPAIKNTNYSNHHVYSRSSPFISDRLRMN